MWPLYRRAACRTTRRYRRHPHVALRSPVRRAGAAPRRRSRLRDSSVCRLRTMANPSAQPFVPGGASFAPSGSRRVRACALRGAPAAPASRQRSALQRPLPGLRRPRRADAPARAQRQPERSCGGVCARRRRRRRRRQLVRPLAPHALTPRCAAHASAAAPQPASLPLPALITARCTRPRDPLTRYPRASAFAPGFARLAARGRCPPPPPPPRRSCPGAPPAAPTPAPRPSCPAAVAALPAARRL